MPLSTIVNQDIRYIRNWCPITCSSVTGTGNGACPCLCFHCFDQCKDEYHNVDTPSGRQVLAANPNSAPCCFPLEPPPPPTPTPPICCSTPVRASDGLAKYSARMGNINYPACC